MLTKTSYSRSVRCLSARTTIVLIALLVLGVVSIAPLNIPRVHAATGEVCLADPSSASTTIPCPTPPPRFDGPKGERIRIGVYVSGSDALNGFDITLVANSSYLAPTGVDLSGTVLPGGAGQSTPVVECLRGILIVAVCAPYDNLTTLHFGATGALGLLTTPPTTGLLFTAIYNITGVTPAGGIPIQYASSRTPISGCLGSSVPPVCVTIANGGTTADSETVQAGTFDNSDSATMAAVTLSATPSRFGPQLPGSNTATINATALHGYPTFGTPADLVTFSASATTGLGTSLSSPTCVTGGMSCTTTLTLTTTAAGNYSTTISGVYATTDPSGNVDTLIANVTLGVFVTDFSISISPTTISFISGSTGAATISLSSINNFAGQITLSTGPTTPLSPPLTISYSPNPVTLAARQTIAATATLSASPTIATTYHVLYVKASSGTRAKTTPALAVNVQAPTPGFSLSASPTIVSAPVGAKANSTITVSGFDGFTGTVSFGVLTNSTNLSCPSPASAPVNGTSTLTCTGSTPGNYQATVTGTSTSPSFTSSTTVVYDIVPPGDFNITANPTSITVLAGVLGNSTISLAPSKDFKASVALSVTTSPTGLLCSLSTMTIAGGNGTSKLSCSAPAGGAYRVTVTGTGGFQSHSVNVTYFVQDFAVSANPLMLIIGQGSSDNSTVTVTALEGFAGVVSLTPSAPTGITPTLTMNSVIGSGSAKLNIAVSGTLAPGFYNVDVTGVSGSLSHKTTVVVKVLGKDFMITAASIIITDPVDSNATSILTISSVVGFSGTVSLNLTLPNGVKGSLNSTRVAVPSSGSVRVLLTVNASLPGSFLVIVTGNSTTASGPLTHNLQFTVLAPGFDIQSSKNPLQILKGGQGTSTITVTGTFGFTGNVTLSVQVNSAGLSCSTSPTIILGGSGTSTLTCNGTVIGNYQATVTGKSGPVSNSTIIVVNVVDFSFSANPTTVTGAATTSLISTVTIGPISGFTGTVSITDTVPSGLSCTFSTMSIIGSGTVSVSCSATVAGNYTLTVTGTSGTLSHSATVTFDVTDFTIVATSPASVTVGTSASSTITVAAVNGFTGTVSLTGISPIGLTCGAISPASLTNSGTATVSCSATVAGNYTLTVTGAIGTLSHFATAAFTVTDFSFVISNSTATLTLAEGQSGRFGLAVSSVNGFSGTVNLSFTVSSNNPRVDWPNVTLTVSSFACPCSDSQSQIIFVVGPTVYPGTYSVNITATGSGGLSDSHIINLQVLQPDFSIKASAQAAIVRLPQETGSTNITLTALYHYNGTVSLALSVTPTGLICSLSQTSLALVPDGSGMTVLSCSGPAGQYSVIVTGTPHEPRTPTTLTHAANVGYSIVDFTISSTPTGILVNTSQDGHAQINVTWARGYAGIVTLTIVPVSGLTATISPSSLTGSGLATLTVNAATAGDYTVVINATSGNVHHTVSITVTVSAPGTSPLPMELLYAVIGVVAVGAAGGAVVVLRKSKKSKK